MAIIFSEDTPPEFMRRYEIVENLHRKELSEDEKAMQTVELIKLIGGEGIYREIPDKSLPGKSKRDACMAELGNRLRTDILHIIAENQECKKPKRSGRPKKPATIVAEVAGVDRHAVPLPANLPRCMALVPQQRRERFLDGVYEAVFEAEVDVTDR